MLGSPLLTQPDTVARERTTLAYLAGLLHAMPADGDALRLLARLFDAIPADDPVELDVFFGQLTRAIAQLAEARRVAFLVRDDTRPWLRWQPMAYGFPDDFVSRARIPCSPTGTALFEQVVFQDFILAGTIADDPAFAPYRDVLQPLEAATAIAVPWRAGDDRLGALIALDPRPSKALLERHTWVLRVAAGLAALVWQRGRAERMVTQRDEHEAQQLRAYAGRLASLEKAKSDFLSLASHELRSPLSVLGGYLSLLADGSLGELPPQLERAVPIMLAKVNQMNVLLTRMLETARLEDSRLQLRLERLDVVAVVRRAVAALEPMALPGQRIVLDAPARPLYALVDRLRAETIVQNLLDNALKYSPRGTDVLSTVSRHKGLARVCVRDQGIGIAPADLPRLFTRFGRIVHDEHRHIAGTGLGLYLARELARMHGGDITVASAVGQGSEFILTLPLATKPKPSDGL
jgi:signal transduction histidine kinase